GGTQRLPRIIGRSRAKELIFNGHRCGAAEAVTMGLANYCVPAGEAYQKALDIAFEITQKEAYSHLPKISSKETHPKIAQVPLERQKYDMTLLVLKNLVDKMMDLPWDSEEEKHLHKSLFDSAQEMPMKPNGRQKLFSNEEKILLNKRVSDLETATSDGLPAIHKAILSKKAAIINYLLRNSANPFIQDKDLLARNAMLAEELLRTGGGMTTDTSQKPSSGRERVQIEALRQELEGAKRQIGALKSEKSQIEAEANNQRNLSVKLESDLKSLSEAYNSIEQANYRLDAEVKALRQGGSVPYPDVEAIKAQAKEEAEKDSEAELNDLLVCLGQEQTKVEKLSTRLTELGEDVDTLLQGIGDDTAIPDDDDEDEDDEEFISTLYNLLDGSSEEKPAAEKTTAGKKPKAEKRVPAGKSAGKEDGESKRGRKKGKKSVETSRPHLSSSKWREWSSSERDRGGIAAGSCNGDRGARGWGALAMTARGDGPRGARGWGALETTARQGGAEEWAEGDGARGGLWRRTARWGGLLWATSRWASCVVNKYNKHTGAGNGIQIALGIITFAMLQISFAPHGTVVQLGSPTIIGLQNLIKLIVNFKQQHKTILTIRDSDCQGIIHRVDQTYC
ncbi:hypothetical protein ACJX0J_021473, partial [Zea mays]